LNRKVGKQKTIVCKSTLESAPKHTNLSANLSISNTFYLQYSQWFAGVGMKSMNCYTNQINAMTFNKQLSQLPV